MAEIVAEQEEREAPPAVDLADLHVYGGLCLAAFGAGALWHWGAGVLLLGAGLVGIGWKAL